MKKLLFILTVAVAPHRLFTQETRPYLHEILRMQMDLNKHLYELISKCDILKKRLTKLEQKTSTSGMVDPILAKLKKAVEKGQQDTQNVINSQAQIWKKIFSQLDTPMVKRDPKK